MQSHSFHLKYMPELCYKILCAAAPADVSEESNKGSQVPPAHQPLMIKCVASTGGWHNRCREILQAAKVKFGKGSQDQKVFIELGILRLLLSFGTGT